MSETGGAQFDPRRDAFPISSMERGDDPRQLTRCRGLLEGVGGFMSATALQSAKIRELGETLIAYLHLDEQARVFGLSRSTTWTIIRVKHKTSGLSAPVLKRMLAQPQLPVLVRIKIDEYVGQESAGMYRHNREQVRRFVAALLGVTPSAARRVESSRVDAWIR